MISYKVLMWDFNRKDIEWYDVMPHFHNEWKRLSTAKRPKTREDITKWLKDESMYHFWARCEYEILVDGFPPSDKPRKIDVHWQILANIDRVVDVFMKNIERRWK